MVVQGNALTRKDALVEPLRDLAVVYHKVTHVASVRFSKMCIG